MKKITIGLLLAFILVPFTLRAQQVTITVSNPSADQRQELIEVDANLVFMYLGLSEGSPIRVINAVRQEVPYQLTHNKHLLIDVSVRPHGEARFTIVPGQPRPFTPVVYGRQYPERVDDIAWENDRGAYRLYGPALQRNKERAFGNDVWTKNTPDLVVEQRYALELSNHAAIVALREAGNTAAADSLEELTTYHFDHGYGLDCYKVGPSLGCGAPALMDAGNIVFPYCYTQYEILDNGPLRFTVSLTYETKDYRGDRVTEHRLLSLDKGSNFNRQTVWYDGLTRPAEVASGVVVHNENAQGYVLADNYVAYADPTDNPAGQNFEIYCAALFPYNHVDTRFTPNEGGANGIAGHVLGIVSDCHSGDQFTYYWGSAWSKYDCRNMQEWQQRIQTFLRALNEPLKVVVEKK